MGGGKLKFSLIPPKLLIQWFISYHYCFVGVGGGGVGVNFHNLMVYMSMAIYGLQGLLNSGSLNIMDIYII